MRQGAGAFSPPFAHPLASFVQAATHVGLTVSKSGVVFDSTSQLDDFPQSAPKADIFFFWRSKSFPQFFAMARVL